MAEETEDQKRLRWAKQNREAKEEWEQAQQLRRNMGRMKAGMYPILTPYIENEVLTRLALGESIDKICMDDYLPASSSIYRWVRENVEFGKKYEQARADGAHAMSSQILDIADEVPDAIFDELGNKKFDPGYISWQKNRMEARKWITAKLMPKIYGDRQAIEGVPGGDPIRHEGEVDVSYEKLMAVMENLEMSKRVQGRDSIKAKPAPEVEDDEQEQDQE